MSGAQLIAADFPIEIDPGNRTITFVFDGAPALTGTWKGKVRDAWSSTSAALDFTTGIDTSAAGSPTYKITVTFTEAQLLGLIPSGANYYEGVYTIEKDTVPWYSGVFRVNQKASR